MMRKERTVVLMGNRSSANCSVITNGCPSSPTDTLSMSDKTRIDLIFLFKASAECMMSVSHSSVNRLIFNHNYLKHP